MRFKQATHPWSAVRRVFGKRFVGSTGDPPVPSGDSPDGTGATVRANGHGRFATLLAAVPVGGSPTGAGGSPAPPIFKTDSWVTKTTLKLKLRLAAVVPGVAAIIA